MIDDPLNAFLESRRTKINEKPEWEIHQAQIGQDLLGVNCGKLFHRFQFDQ